MSDGVGKGVFSVPTPALGKGVGVSSLSAVSAICVGSSVGFGVGENVGVLLGTFVGARVVVGEMLG